MPTNRMKKQNAEVWGGKFEAPGPPSVRSRTQEPNKKTERKTRLSPLWSSLERLQLKKNRSVTNAGRGGGVVDILLLLQVRFGRFGKVFFFQPRAAMVRDATTSGVAICIKLGRALKI
ncbi:hypothetical protein A9K55_006873 [Cordyceps militaris]|uniref:Uncharacterized protein n=1 Tax=Cordyceps militaris TaxID=73501 RepID=A0A2H4S9X0_CORMI|nr:hypothetical protein A9K55_006873 [Cordyceps militaris]